MLEVSGLTCRVNNREILRDISFSLTEGELTILLGPNGAGKTTLLNAVSGWLRPCAGKIFIEGVPLEKIPLSQKAMKIGVMPQHIPDVPYLTVEEIVLMGRMPYCLQTGRYSGLDREKAKKVMEATGISGLASRYYSTLSGGEKQRVFLAKTLVQEASLLLLDEPLANLDLHFGWETMEILARHCHDNKVTIMASLHDINMAGAFADKIIFLHEGKIERQGKTGEVLESKFLSGIYGLDIRLFSQGENGFFGVVKS